MGTETHVKTAHTQMHTREESNAYRRFPLNPHVNLIFVINGNRICTIFPRQAQTHHGPEAENLPPAHPARNVYTIETFYVFGMRILDADFFSLVTWALYPQYITGVSAVG